jgi:hypothetical protein
MTQGRAEVAAVRTYFDTPWTFTKAVPFAVPADKVLQVSMWKSRGAQTVLKAPCNSARSAWMSGLACSLGVQRHIASDARQRLNIGCQCCFLKAVVNARQLPLRTAR